MATLPTNLKDDILDASVNQRRRYNMITNPDGTVEFEDVTVYSQVGSEYGAGLINETNKQINGKVDDSKIVRDLKTIGAMTQEGFIPDALALKEVNESLQGLTREVELWSQNEIRFSAQTITIQDLTDYKSIKIYWSPWESNIPSMCTEVPVGTFNAGNSILFFYGENRHWRYFNINGNDIIFGEGMVNGESGIGSAVPLKIIGIK